MKIQPKPQRVVLRSKTLQVRKKDSYLFLVEELRGGEGETLSIFILLLLPARITSNVLNLIYYSMHTR